MYFVPDDTEICGYYECQECGERFLDVKVVPSMVCPYCGEEVDIKLEGMSFYDNPRTDKTASCLYS